ncbi:MAG: hypothetical protein ABI972_30635, partial [Acidobacteriota bacterium]
LSAEARSSGLLWPEVTRRTLLTLTASPLLRAADPFEDRWRAAADRVIEASPAALPFAPPEGMLMLALMRLYQRTKYPLYTDFVETWAKHHLANAQTHDDTIALAVLLLQDARPNPLFERYVTNAVDSAEGPESASFLARYGMTRRQPGLVLRAARSLPVRPPVPSDALLAIADVLEALEPMQPDYEPLSSCAQSVRPAATDLLSLAAAWKLVRIQVVPAARGADALAQWKLVHNQPTPDPIAPYDSIARYLLAAAEAAATL